MALCTKILNNVISILHQSIQPKWLMNNTGNNGITTELIFPHALIDASA